MSSSAPYGTPQVGPPGRAYGSSGVGPPQRTSAPSHPYGSQTRPVDDDERSHQSGQHPEGEPQETYEDEEEKPRYKYSTANMHRPAGRWKKYCCILLLFLIFMAISIGISIAIQKIFFPPNTSSPAANGNVTRPSNDPFPLDKSTVDGACSTSVFNQNGGTQCKQLCKPNFFECCDPFNEYALFNLSNDPFATPNFNLTCSLSEDLRGCVSYSKCQAASGLNDPAPSTLPILCTDPRLSQDPTNCIDICDRQRCCYEPGPNNCETYNFNACLDYAPCQNLRGANATLQTAPTNLDYLCYINDPQCGFFCQNAQCCDLNHPNTCFADNVITCMTYAACSESNLTSTNITIPPMFSAVPHPPTDMLEVCNVNGVYSAKQNLGACATYCSMSKCCRATDSTNCFLQDPLGCMEWNYQCSVVKQ